MNRLKKYSLFSFFIPILRHSLTIFLLLLLGGTSLGFANQGERHYQAIIAPDYDLDTVLVNSRTLYTLTQDFYTFTLKKRLPKRLGNVMQTLWSASFTYLFMIWPHEFGHYFRAKQVNGYFKIHNIAPPFPYTTMHLPDDISLRDETLSVTGGFEINYLTARNIQLDFFRRAGLHADELSLFSAHRLMYPIYTVLVVPIDPEDPEVWVRTAGDPVHYIKPVWEMYSAGRLFTADGRVDPGLVKFYNEAKIFSIAWTLADPTFIQSLVNGLKAPDVFISPWFLVNKERFKWSYGTMFSVSPLGYELYLNNYFILDKFCASLYVKYGYPFTNISLGVTVPSLSLNHLIALGGGAEIWKQKENWGAMVYAETEIIFNGVFGITLKTGWKDEGFVIGKKFERGFFGHAGLVWHRTAKKPEKQR